MNLGASFVESPSGIYGGRKTAVVSEFQADARGDGRGIGISYQIDGVAGLKENGRSKAPGLGKVEDGRAEFESSEIAFVAKGKLLGQSA